MFVQVEPPLIPPDAARDAADQVLAGRAYVEASRPPSAQERLFDWIAERFADLLNSLSSTGGRGFIAWIVIGIFGAFAIYLAVRLFRTYEPFPAQAKPVEPTIDIIGDRSAADWLAMAEQAEAAGDFRNAIRCRHRVLVATLLERGLITPRPGLTAGEIASMVAQNAPATADPVNSATWLFKDTWYGGLPATSRERDRFIELSDATLVAIDQAPALVSA